MMLRHKDMTIEYRQSHSMPPILTSCPQPQAHQCFHCLQTQAEATIALTFLRKIDYATITPSPKHEHCTDCSLPYHDYYLLPSYREYRPMTFAAIFRGLGACSVFLCRKSMQTNLVTKVELAGFCTATLSVSSRVDQKERPMMPAELPATVFRKLSLISY